MKIVLKYSFAGDNFVSVPVGPIRAVAFQRGEVCVWVEVDKFNARRDRILIIYPTGVDVGPFLNFVGTAVSDDLVWHVYERAAAFQNDQRY